MGWEVVLGWGLRVRWEWSEVGAGYRLTHNIGKGLNPPISYHDILSLIKEKNITFPMTLSVTNEITYLTIDILKGTWARKVLKYFAPWFIENCTSKGTFRAQVPFKIFIVIFIFFISNNAPNSSQGNYLIKRQHIFAYVSAHVAYISVSKSLNQLLLGNHTSALM